MSSVRRWTFLAVVAALAAPAVTHADVRLPALVGSHMILQRDAPSRVWGWAAPGEAVRVSVGPAKGEAVAGTDGRWSVDLPPQPAGGPFSLTVAGRNTLTLEDVWFGEVWVASGQSNMEWPLAQSIGGPEAAAAGCDGLRLFTVAKATSLPEKDDVSGRWAPCDASTAPGFSAVAFFFGRELHRALGVEVGLVHSSWGGTPAEAWTSRSALEKEPSLRPLVADFDLALNDAEARKTFAARLEAWEAANYHRDVSNEGLARGWAKPETPSAGWGRMDLPQQWERAGLPIDGAVWFRRAVEIPAAWAGKDLRLSLGALDDFDTTYFAGEEIGRTGKETPGYWAVPRLYTVPGRLVKAGRAVVAARVFDHYGGGGFSGVTPDLWIAPADSSGAKVPLAGPWEYQVERSLPPSTPDFATQPRYPSADNSNSPTVLYGAMIAPLTPLAIRGALWYQGESNAGAAFQYRTLFPAMIRDWRRAWGRGDFPFLFVQLANYMARAAEPGESAWAELREAQAMTLALPKTGMAVAIDIGETSDIHPKNKHDVGARLARWALADTYGQPAVRSGPLYRSFSVEGAAVRVRFDHGEGLATADGRPPKGFAIAGADRKWRWAEARIDGQTVVVSSPEVPRPVAARYAWADDPEATLRNGAGLPASPFRTDDWPMLTAPRGPADGRELVKAMHARYADRWYRDFMLVQDVTRHREGGEEARERVTEYLSLPGRVRAITGPIEDGNAEIYTGGAFHIYEKGQLTRQVEYVHGVLVLGFDVYVQEPRPHDRPARGARNRPRAPPGGGLEGPAGVGRGRGRRRRHVASVLGREGPPPLHPSGREAADGSARRRDGALRAARRGLDRRRAPVQAERPARDPRGLRDVRPRRPHGPRAIRHEDAQDHGATARRHSRRRPERVLPQPGHSRIPPRPERRPRRGGLLPRHQQLRVLPRGAGLHEPGPRPLEAAGPRAHAREPAAPAEGPAVGRRLRAHDPVPRRHLLHDHDERRRRRELLRHREGPGRALVRAHVAPRLRRDRPVALLRRRRDRVPDGPGQRSARSAARDLPDDPRRQDREDAPAPAPRVGPHRHALPGGAAPLQGPRALLPDDRRRRHGVRPHGHDRAERLAVGPVRGLPPQPDPDPPPDPERHARSGHGPRRPRRGRRRELVDGVPRFPLRLRLLASPRPRDVPRAGHVGRGRAGPS